MWFIPRFPPLHLNVFSNPRAPSHLVTPPHYRCSIEHNKMFFGDVLVSQRFLYMCSWMIHRNPCLKEISQFIFIWARQCLYHWLIILVLNWNNWNHPPYPNSYFNHYEKWLNSSLLRQLPIAKFQTVWSAIYRWCFCFLHTSKITIFVAVSKDETQRYLGSLATRVVTSNWCLSISFKGYPWLSNPRLLLNFGIPFQPRKFIGSDLPAGKFLGPVDILIAKILIIPANTAGGTITFTFNSEVIFTFPALIHPYVLIVAAHKTMISQNVQHLNTRWELKLCTLLLLTNVRLGLGWKKRSLIILSRSYTTTLSTVKHPDHTRSSPAKVAAFISQGSLHFRSEKGMPLLFFRRTRLLLLGWLHLLHSQLYPLLYPFS